MNSLVMGRRGLGKTTLAEWLARRMNPNRIAFDPGGQYRDFLIITSDLEQVEEELSREWDSKEPLSLAYVAPVGPDPTADQVEPYWNDFAALLWRYTGQHEGGASYVLIVDEASELQSPAYVNPWLERFIRRAPRRERGDANPVDMIETFHRPQDLNGIMSSQVDEWWIFNMVKARDLEVIAKEFGEEISEAVRALRTPKSDPPGRDVLRLDAETNEWEIITDSSIWFVNIRQPQESRPRTWKMSELSEMYGGL